MDSGAMFLAVATGFLSSTGALRAWDGGGRPLQFSLQPHFASDGDVSLDGEQYRLIGDSRFDARALTMVTLLPSSKQSELALVEMTNGMAPMTYGGCPTHRARGIMHRVFHKQHMRMVHDYTWEGTSDGPAWDLFYPCSHGKHMGLERALERLKVGGGRPKAIFAVDGSVFLHYKDRCWKALVDAYGRRVATTLMPESFLSQSASDMALLRREYRPGDRFILKKNIEMKRGLELVDPNAGIKAVLREAQEFPVVQRLLTSLAHVKGYKLNLRVFVLVLCDRARDDNTALNTALVRKRAFVYENFKCLYPNRTSSEEQGDVDLKAQITGFRFDEDAYAEKNLPLNRAQLLKYWAGAGVRGGPAAISTMQQKLGRVVSASWGQVCANPRLANATRFSIFGADTVFTHDLDPIVIELNMAPSYAWTNNADFWLKFRMVSDAFALAGVFDQPRNTRNGFVQVAENTDERAQDDHE